MLKAKPEKLSIEEVANTITHGFGLALSIAGFIVLLIFAFLNGSFWHIFASFIYGLSLITLYAASTFYHGTSSPNLKRRLQILDHCCIYLLIAGSYTPFTLVVLHNAFGQDLCIFVWLFALAGILLKIFFFEKFPLMSVFSYILLGWTGILVIKPLLAALGSIPIALIIAGGISYTLGVIFFMWHKLPHHHAIWNVFVMAGSIFHYLAIILYVIPFTVPV